MNNDSSTSPVIPEAPAQALGKNQLIVTRPNFEYVPEKEEGAGRPSIFENQRIMALLESAYKIGSTHEEAALHAGMASISPIKYHITAKSVLKIIQNGKDTGQRVTFPELVDLWKGNLTLAAKNAVYQSIAKGDTQNSWRVLERKQRAEWGLQAGQGSVDGGTVSVPVLGAESVERMKEFEKPPAETPKPEIHPTEAKGNAESAPAIPPVEPVPSGGTR